MKPSKDEIEYLKSSIPCKKIKFVEKFYTENSMSG